MYTWVWSAASILLFIGLAIGESQTEDPLLVSLTQGRIRGVMEQSTKGKPIFSFQGIPYAKPPVGDLRFKDPEDPEGWRGVRDADKTQSCSQIFLILLLRDGVSPQLGSEDCLFLNVYTPKIGSPDLPVMVFFHGGAYVSGSSAFYDPQELLNEEVILVTVNYRLAILGFLSTGDSIMPGNLGIKDQTKSLRWVKSNIERFGGNPNRVTIFGGSAGGGSIHFHLISKHSQGLFSRAILQSGTLLCPWAKTSDVRNTALTIGEHFKCFDSDPHLEGEAKSRQLRECLLNIDAEELTLATNILFEWTFLPLLTGPYVDGDFFPIEPEVLLREGKTKPLDVIFGVTRDEGAVFSNGWLSLEEQRKAIAEHFSVIGPLSLGLQKEEEGIDMSKRAYEFFVGGIRNRKEDYDNLNRMFGDRHFSVCSDWVSLFQAKANEGTNKEVYYYELNHRGQRSQGDPFNLTDGKHWVSHADELFYLFSMKRFAAVERNEEDSKIRDVLVKTWVNFAKTGNPTPDDSLGFIWEPFTFESRRHLSILPDPMMEEDTRQEVRDFWASLPTKQNKLLFGEEIYHSREEETKDEL